MREMNRLTASLLALALSTPVYAVTMGPDSPLPAYPTITSSQMQSADMIQLTNPRFTYGTYVTGPTLSTYFDSLNHTLAGTWTFNGAATFNSTATFGGNVAINSGLTVANLPTFTACTGAMQGAGSSPIVCGVLSSSYGGAGSVNGVLQADGAGIVSAFAFGTGVKTALGVALNTTNGLVTAPVGNAVLASMAGSTIKCNNVGVSSTPSDCTGAQTTALLNAFVGDSGSGGTKGLVPAPATGDAASNKFLKADGTWSVTPSSTPLTCAGLPNGARCLLATLTASNSAALSDTTDITSTYSEYEVVFENLVPVTNAVSMQFQVYSGGSYQSSSYVTVLTHANVTGTYSGTTITTSIPIQWPSLQANSAPGLSGSVRFSNPSQTTSPKIFWGTTAGVLSANTFGRNGISGFWNANGAITGFQVNASSGNISSGVIKIYGWN